jgi:hypothetical protein
MDKRLRKRKSAFTTRKLPSLSKAERAERAAAIKAVNRIFTDLALAVRREFVGISNWKELSKSKASIATRVTTAIQNVDSASADVLDKATRTAIQEIYAIEEWPTTKRLVVARTTAAIRRLKLGAGWY